MANEINVPQLILVLLLSGVAIRYFFFGNTSPSTRPRPRSESTARAREADVERIQQMFPQISRRHIMWNLQRDGGNVAATTERVLSGRGLEVPPQSFQPPLPVPATSSTASPTVPASSKPAQPDLITRYNLASKIAAGAEESPADTDNKKQAWSQNKVERQALLQRRRDEMILAARKKMEEKVKAEQAVKAGAASS